MNQAKYIILTGFLIAIFHSGLFSQNQKQLQSCVGDTLIEKAYRFQEQSQFDTAIVYFTNALMNYQNKKDHYKAIKCIHEISKCYRRMNRLQLAKNFADSSINLAYKYLDEDNLLLADCHDNMGIIGLLGGGVSFTHDYFKRSLNIKLKQLGENNEKTADSYRYIGLLLEKSNDTIESIKYLNRANEIYQNVLEPTHEKIASINNNLGLYYKRIYGHNEKALKHYLKALKIYKLNFGEVDFRVAGISNNIALAYEILGQYKMAEKYLLYALDIQKNVLGENHPDLGMTYYNLATFYTDTKQYYKALKHLQLAIIIYKPDFHDTSIFSNPMNFKTAFHKDLFIALKTKPDVWVKIYKETKDSNVLNYAVNTWLLCTKLIDEFYSKIQDENEKLTLSEEMTHIYHYGTYYAATLYKLTKNPKYFELAFIFAEKHKARLLVNTLSRIRKIKQKSPPDSLINLEKKHLSKISSLESYIYKIRKSSIDSVDVKIRKLEDSLFFIKESFTKLKKQIEKKYPEYYNLQNRSNEVSISKLQSSLKSGETILQYMTIDLEQPILPEESTTLVIFMIKKDSSDLIMVEMDSIFHKQVKELRKSILKNKFRKSSIPNYKLLTYEVYKKTVKPYAKSILNNDIIIIPDGIIATFPFEILLTNKADSINNYKKLPYLLKKHNIVYNFSSSLYYYSLKFKPEKGLNNLLAMAPSFNDYETSIQNLYAEREDEFIDLSEARKEVKKIGELVRGNIITGKNATKSFFLNNASNYKIIHLATHSFIDFAQPLNSYILFSSNNKKKDYEKLFTYDLFQTNLNAELAVLSTCSSGYGKIHNSEGLLSIARDFIYSGVPNVVMSLWNINDIASAMIMESFYKKLKANKSKSEALREAKLDFIKNADHIMSNPYFWGGIVLIGNHSGINLNNKKISTTHIIITVILTLLIFFAIVYFFKRKI